MNKGSGFRQGLSIGVRLGTEMLAATLIGTVMGYALDKFLGTKPWFLAIGVMLGGAAGCLNVYRAAQEISFKNNDDDQNEQNLE